MNPDEIEQNGKEDTMFLNYNYCVHSRFAILFSGEYISAQFKDSSKEVIDNGCMTDEAGWCECFGIGEVTSQHFHNNLRQKDYWKQLSYSGIYFNIVNF